MIEQIVSERNNSDLKYNQIVYEWEDLFADYFDCGLDYLYKCETNKYWEILKEVFGTFVPFKNNKKRLGFVLFVRMSHRYKKDGMIPIYLDVHDRWVSKIVRDTRNLDLFFVTSYDLFEQIKKINNDNRCVYLPLSIHDKYITDICDCKTIDVVQLGRKNEKLHSFMVEFLKEFPTVKYVYFENNEYVSNHGETFGALNSRAEYIQMLRSAKVSLVSSPGVDTRKFGKFDFFSPRFYESIAAYCYLIGRYTYNKEARLLNINEYCKNVDKYQEFRELLIGMLGKDNNELLEKYSDFLDKNSTSARAKYISQFL